MSLLTAEPPIRSAPQNEEDSLRMSFEEFLDWLDDDNIASSFIVDGVYYLV